MADDVEKALNSISSQLSQFRPRKSIWGRPIILTTAGFDSPVSEVGDADWIGNKYGDSGLADAPPVALFKAGPAGPLVAVDAGCRRLGETDEGIVIALRAAVVIDDHGSTQARLYRTGPLYLSNFNKCELLHALGVHMGEGDYYVQLDDANPPKPTSVKKGVADKAVQYSDRFRAFLERLVQGYAVSSVRNGQVLFDGALTLRTRDSPDSYLRGLARTASKCGNGIIGVSKTSELQIQGRSVRFWLDDAVGPCYRNLTALIRQEDSSAEQGRAERVLGNVYSARFSVLGPTFRVDVMPPRGGSDKESLDQFISSAGMRGGYPDILVRAHALSYFSSEAVMQLQAQACAQFGLRPRPDVSLSATFAPFGGRYK